MQATKIFSTWIRNKIGILLEIILNAFKCLSASLSTEIPILVIYSFN